MLGRMQPRAFIIAGPNGAGKSTFAGIFLARQPRSTRFINADLIAAGISPFRPEEAALRAGKLMLEEVREAVAAREDFAVETTLSGRGYLRHIRDWQEAGYHVKLLFLQLNNAEMAVRRVAKRVRYGGHSIPVPVIHRRFALGIANFEDTYKSVVDSWSLYDNSAGEMKFLKGGAKDA